jgi:hypothetical protein
MSLIDAVVGQREVRANGWSGTLDISSVDGQGNLTGRMTITTNDQGAVTGEAATTIAGYWDANTQEACFIRDMKNILPSNALPFQIYTGYRYRAERPGTRDDTLAGFFEGLFSTERHRFGWIASRGLPG